MEYITESFTIIFVYRYSMSMVVKGRRHDIRNMAGVVGLLKQINMCLF